MSLDFLDASSIQIAWLVLFRFFSSDVWLWRNKCLLDSTDHISPTSTRVLHVFNGVLLYLHASSSV